ncbi:MAG: aldose epimerase family protein [Bacteroidota bacterium]
MISMRKYGVLTTGEEINIYTLTNKTGSKTEIINYGAIVVSLCVPDKNGKLDDVVTGYDSLDGYVEDKFYFGAIVGRYGNRIAKGKFKLDGKEYQLTVNNGENHLHGGSKGVFKAVWKVEPIETADGPSLKLSYNSPEGEEGYPGNVKMEVIYTLTDLNELVVEYKGETDKATILNPTHHSYFNLSGDFNTTVLEHQLFIDADYTTEVGSDLIPTGKLIPVSNTPMDFRKQISIGSKIESNDEQILFGKGYDHNWVLRNFDGKVRTIATLYDSKSGRLMEVSTDQPGVQFYSGNFLDGTMKGKNGIAYNFRSALCLETQHFPDSPNQPGFPTVTLRPGEIYKQKTIYRFLTK